MNELAPTGGLKTLYREDLLVALCANPECKVNHSGELMFLHPSCHPHAPVQVSFVSGDPSSMVVVLCALCEKPVCLISVAPNPSLPSPKLEMPEGFAA